MNTIIITSIDISYAEVTVKNSKEKEFLPIKRHFNYTIHINSDELSGVYTDDYYDEIHIPSIINHIRLSLIK
jgi:hypothetical protein